jgi:hypothetical protein
MAVATTAITIERLAPAGERVARATGAVVVGTGSFLIARAAGLGSREALGERPGGVHLFDTVGDDPHGLWDADLDVLTLVAIRAIYSLWKDRAVHRLRLAGGRRAEPSAATVELAEPPVTALGQWRTSPRAQEQSHVDA